MASDSEPARNPPGGKGRRPDRDRPSRWGDAALAVLFLVTDAVVVAGTVVFFAFRSLPGVEKGRTATGPAHPESLRTVDWAPVITFGVVAAVVLVTGVVLLRGRLVITGTVQAVVAVLIAAGTVHGGAHSWRTAHLDPAPVIQPACVCRSAGGGCDCPGG
ncbi:DUF6234 family protein [Streptomyces sp. NPDC051561]|uniref:DUF6234 family protein n=1 Tax=Streptomyces sp. NPDC051561 TaxID=3365658 RepID=UPI003794F2E7